MSQQLLTFLELSYPFAAAFTIAALCFFIKKGDQKATLSFPYFLGEFKLPMSSAVLTRIILLFVAATFLALPAFKDYSKFFPTFYGMNTYFDNAGIEKSLDEFTENEIEELNIAENWKQKKSDYLNSLSQEISEKLGIKNFFNNGTENIHSKGSTSFVVKKVKGWQTYHIQTASGQLTHTLEIPNTPITQFTSKFELLNRSNNFIKADLVDIYINWTKILKPYFKQLASISNNEAETLYHHNLVACIKVRFFPVASIGNTIYLVKGENNSWIPIGYAVYSPMD